FSDPFSPLTQPHASILRVWMQSTTLSPMITTRTLRSMVLAPLLMLAALGTAQLQYFVHLSGHHTPCTADVQDGFVHIVSEPFTVPDYDIEVPINANCYYTVTLEVNSWEYGFSITSGCASPITVLVVDSLISV